MHTRTKNAGLMYLRRSGSKQEMSLPSQLDWAISKSAALQVKLDATRADLDYMLKARLHTYKSIRLDDAVTGADMLRPGFLATKSDVLADKSISHLFIHMRDRFARPEEALAMASIEKEIRQNGVTLVFSNAVGDPMQLGAGDLGEDLKIIVEYYMSGDYLRKLSERIIDAQRRLAQGGHWTGGVAPWGFMRVLVDQQGNVLEELAPGRSVKQPGCHVQLRPKDQEKLEYWMRMLDWVLEGWGSKRIANRLNELGIPSPNVGKIRKDRGVEHINDGKWNGRTVLEILRNPAIIGNLQYGRRSMGAHRRLAADGYRLLDPSDRTESNKPRVIRNSKSLRIEKSGGYEALYDPAKWLVIQTTLDERGEVQAGIPRVSDLSKYPLSCRVVDMTNNCGNLMYARTSGERRQYVCGRYMKHGPTACDNNSVDAEALLKTVLEKITCQLDRHGGMDRIREMLLERAKTVTPGVDRVAAERQSLQTKITQLESEKSNLVRRMRSASDELYNDLKREYDEIIGELRNLTKRCEGLPIHTAVEVDPQKEVFAAMSLLHNFEAVLADPTARERVPDMLKQFGIMIGLNFRSATKGKRLVRKLDGGVMAFRGTELPVKLHGRDSHDADFVGDEVEPKCECGPDCDTNKKSRRGRKTPAAAESLEVRPQEGISYTKGSRGDRI